ncbi:MAG: AAA-like domain-containing protein [Cyanobacteria bacterium P01_F01_bin.143]
MTLEETLAIVDNLIQPERLTTLQEIILRQCWQGKTYQQIAEDSDYDADYIRVVGSRLWQILSDACAEKVTKNNFRAILRQQSGQVPSSEIHLELPDGSIPLKSNFYIERPPVEETCYEAIRQPGALIRIKAPKNMGKTSLLTRILAAQNYQYNSVRLDLQQVDHRILKDLNKLLRWLCANICSQLGLKNLIDDYWDKDLGIKVSCTAYIQNYILQQLEKPLILSLDQLHLIFEHTEVAQEFLPLLRFWHEEANNLAIWQKLHLIVIQSTESYVPLDFNQSPFNVGLPIVLPEFNSQQIMDLAQRHQIKWQDENECQSLISIIGGHPYLVRLAFYHLAKYNVTWEQLLEKISTETSIYRDILLHYLATLYHNPALATAFKQVILSDNAVTLESFVAYKLESLGLISLRGNEAVPSCQLYRLYFRDRLNQF